MRRPGTSVADHSRSPKLDVVNDVVSAPCTQADRSGATPSFLNARLAAIAGAHCGIRGEGEAAFARLNTFGPPAVNQIGPIPYTALNAMLDPAFPKAALSYWKAQFVTELSDDVIGMVLAAFESCPSAMSQIIIEHFHGAPSRVPVDATACTISPDQ